LISREDECTFVKHVLKRILRLVLQLRSRERLGSPASPFTPKKNRISENIHSNAALKDAGCAARLTASRRATPGLRVIAHRWPRGQECATPEPEVSSTFYTYPWPQNSEFSEELRSPKSTHCKKSGSWDESRSGKIPHGTSLNHVRPQASPLEPSRRPAMWKAPTLSS
jgi:hypothetical protein